MRIVAVFVLALAIAGSSSSPILDWGKKDGNSLLEKVATIKQTVYEKKREFFNGINERVSKALMIPPWPSATTEETTVDVAVQQDPIPVSETPSIWWWQSTPKPEHAVSDVPVSTIVPSRTSTTTVRSTITGNHPTPTVAKGQPNDDRLVFTVADTDELELPIVSMYARSNLIPKELLLTDSVEYTGPIFGGGPPQPAHDTNRLIMV